MTLNLTEEELSRRKKLEALQAAGVDPYPSTAHRTHTAAEALEHFDALMEGKTDISLCGRLRLVRPHGKSTFANIEDASGKIQVYFQQDVLGEAAYDLTAQLDLGDIIECSGVLFTTKKGERTLQVRAWKLLTKSLRPLPEKWHGLRDHELRARKRYLDLIVNPEVRELFLKKNAFYRAMRSFLEGEKFIEVETPTLEHIPGGADANPFITHHNTLDIDLYLRISLELHLKRLMVGGFEKIFEIGKVFRNEGMSTQHLQEFTMLEFYWAYADWNDLIAFVERMYASVIEKTFGTLKIPHGDTVLDFTTPWPRVDYVEAIKKETGIDIEKYPTEESLLAAIEGAGMNVDEDKIGRGRIIDTFYKKYVRPKLVQPTLLLHHPVDVSPLAKRDPKNPQRTERVQVLVAGAEVGNGWSELNDPIDQRARFEQQMRLREAGDSEAQMLDEDFLCSLEHGMPPTAGFGVGLDRLFMILSASESIRDVVLFPTMKQNSE